MVEILVKIYDYNATKGEEKEAVGKEKEIRDDVSDCRTQKQKRRRSFRRLSVSKRKRLFGSDAKDETFLKNEKDSVMSPKRENVDLEKLKIEFRKTPINPKRRCKSRLTAYRSRSPRERLDDPPLTSRLTEKQKAAYSSKMKENNKILMKRSNSKKRVVQRNRYDEALKSKNRLMKYYRRSGSRKQRTQSKRKQFTELITKQNQNEISNFSNRILTPFKMNNQRYRSDKPKSKVFSALSRKLHDTYKRSEEEKKAQDQKITATKSDSIVVDKIQAKHIKKVKTWLIQKLYCKSSTDFKNLHIKSKDGVFLFDLVNKIERKTVLRGKSTASETSIRMNYKKIMNHLKKHERFNTRYLRAENYLMEGDFNVFWGFLLDIYFFSLNKFSIFDKRYYKQPIETPSDSLKLSNISQISPFPSDMNVLNGKSSTDLLFDQSIYCKYLCNESSIGFGVIPSDQTESDLKCDSSVFDKNKVHIHTFGSQKNMPDQDVQAFTDSLQNPKLSLDYKKLVLLEAKVKGWLDKLGFDMIYHCNVNEDKLRNGYILHKILELIRRGLLLKDFREPESPEECLSNLKFYIRKLSIFDERIKNFNPEKILKGEPNTIWKFYDILREIWGENYIAKSLKDSSKFQNSLTIPSEDFTPPMEIFDWVLSLNIFDRQMMPYNYQELLLRMGDGLLLATIVEKVFKVKVNRINQSPRGRMDCFNNIRFCIGEMRKFKSMNPRYFNRVKQIYDLSPEECFGLLKDIMTFHKKMKNENGYLSKNLDITRSSYDTKVAQTLKKKRFFSKETPKNQLKMSIDKNMIQSYDNRFGNRGRVLDLDSRIIRTKDYREVSNRKREQKRLDFSGEKRAIVTRSPFKPSITEDHSLPDFTPPLSFQAVKSVIRLLVYLDMPKVIERENWDSTVWSQFSDG